MEGILLAILVLTCFLPDLSWAHTLGNGFKLKYQEMKRDGSNAAPIVTFPGILQTATGTAAAPAWSFGSDTDTGVMSPADGQVAVYGNGSLLWTLAATSYCWGNLDFFYAGSPRLNRLTPSGSVPVYTYSGNTTTGLGRYALGMPSMISSATEIQRWYSGTATGTDVFGTASFSGNVSANADLTVAGNASVAGKIECDGFRTNGINSSIGTFSTIAFGGLVLGGAGGAQLHFTSESAGAGMKNWAFQQVQTAFGDFALKQSNSQYGNANTAGTTRLYFTPAGEVCIGADSDRGSEVLQVTGTASFSGAITAPSVIQQQANKGFFLPAFGATGASGATFTLCIFDLTTSGQSQFVSVDLFGCDDSGSGGERFTGNLLITNTAGTVTSNPTSVTMTSVSAIGTVADPILSAAAVGTVVTVSVYFPETYAQFSATVNSSGFATGAR